MSRSTLLGFAVAILLLIGGTALFFGRGNPRTAPSALPSISETRSDQPLSDREPGENPGAPTDLGSETENRSTISVAEESAGASPLPDPRSQPRSYYEVSFAGVGGLPDGFRFSNITQTAEGIAIDPSAPVDEEGKRRGVAESPPQVFDFPSNGLVPLWKAEVPATSDVEIEVAFSFDGENWSEWFPFHAEGGPHDEIRPTYPDGRPNPNYGYSSGGLLAFGTRQYENFRYRIILTGDADESPVFTDFRLYHHDSTLGQGQPARENPRLAGRGSHGH